MYYAVLYSHIMRPSLQISRISKCVLPRMTWPTDERTHTHTHIVCAHMHMVVWLLSASIAYLMSLCNAATHTYVLKYTCVWMIPETFPSDDRAMAFAIRHADSPEHQRQRRSRVHLSRTNNFAMRSRRSRAHRYENRPSRKRAAHMRMQFMQVEQ